MYDVEIEVPIFNRGRNASPPPSVRNLIELPIPDGWRRKFPEKRKQKEGKFFFKKRKKEEKDLTCQLFIIIIIVIIVIIIIIN